MEMTYKDFMEQPILKIYLSEDRGERVEAVKRLVAASIDEAIRRRDAELLEKVEGMRRRRVLNNQSESTREEYEHWKNGYNQAIDDIIKLIKGE